MCIFVPSTVMSSWEHVAAVSCSCLTDAVPQRIIGQARYYRSLVLLDKIINIIVRWLQVVPVCMDTYTVLIIACLVTSTLFANGTVTRQSLHVRHWCSCLDIYGTMVVISNIPSLLDKNVGQDCWTSSSPFIYNQPLVILRWCYHMNNTIIYIRLQQLLHHLLHRLKFCCRLSSHCL